MPLALSLREEDAIYIADKRWVVSEIHDDHAVMTGPNGRSVTVVETKGAELEPYVFVSLGWDVTDTTTRFVFRAPRNIAIMREALYQSGA